MAILSPHEKEIMGRFENGGDIKNEEEGDVLTRYGTIGLVTFGFLSKRARLTDKGKLVLKYY
ncbi:MAG: hypothetical protein CVT89_06020 [Candidatus Altiarchaeales archaeon HGW-Altiarchaeales-2]|nr:MAG: hypothetical protein CVT89_06020 [Candidatus Altiarchaeales archaeon HGW-Altiarchaeales-2]